jgi:hypothetical protein
MKFETVDMFATYSSVDAVIEEITSIPNADERSTAMVYAMIMYNTIANQLNEMQEEVKDGDE